MTHEQAVREKIIRQETFKPDEVISRPAGTFYIEQGHPFQQKTIIQKDYEQRSFLGFNYKKLVGTKVIPIALCKICDELEIEHA
jgi:hypothetical protein